jgi:hypothetical protein
LLSLVLVVAACGGGDDSSNNGGADGGSGSGGDAGGDGGGSGACPRTPAAADRTRYVVVAHPYTAGGSASPKFEVLKLTADGTLSRFEPARTFTLGSRAAFGVIPFTPDGQVGIVPLDNGNLGVFTLDGEGTPTVVDANFDGAFYADRVVIDPSGDKAWVIDRNTRENGGGVYSVTINCDGSLTDGAQVVAAKSPGGFGFVGSKAVLVAKDALDTSTAGDDIHLLDWSTATPTLLGGGDAFGDDNAITSGFALSHDGMTAFIGDSNVVGTNRVAVVSVGASDITPVTVFSTNVTDPSGIAASPFGDVALVTMAQPPDEGIYVLDKQGTNSTWRIRGELTYAGGGAQLPGDVVMIEQGQLAGHVLVSELSRVRQVTFGNGGTVTDTSSLVFGSGTEEILGAIGVTP